jgi:hypothetical protein
MVYTLEATIEVEAPTRAAAIARARRVLFAYPLARLGVSINVPKEVVNHQGKGPPAYHTPLAPVKPCP